MSGYANYKRKEVNLLGYFAYETPTDATHAISKSGRKFQNRILRELDTNISPTVDNLQSIVDIITIISY